MIKNDGFQWLIVCYVLKDEKVLALAQDATCSSNSFCWF